MEQKRRHHRYGRARKKRKSRLVSTLILVVSAAVFVFAAVQLVRQTLPYYTGGKEYDKVRDLALTAGEQEDGRLKIDFAALKAENPDTVAWIQFEEPSVINYPVVQSKDNKEYLTKTFSDSDNKLGAIFMDMRNTSFRDRNVFIYGHNMKVGGEMFSQLNAYADEEFCREHPYFYIYTAEGKVLQYQVFSAGVIKDTAENYQISYASEEEFVRYLDLCKASSAYAVDVELNAESKIVSLSTCTNVRDDERFLVQGVLVKEEYCAAAEKAAAQRRRVPGSGESRPAEEKSAG